MASLECHIHLLQGRNLSVKDRDSSDPFVRIYLDDGGVDRVARTFDGDGADCLFQSRAKSRTVNPKYNEKFRHTIHDPNVISKVKAGTSSTCYFVFSIFDEDGMHGEDAMGRIRIPISLEGSTAAEWYPVEEGGQGELQVKLEVFKLD